MVLEFPIAFCCFFFFFFSSRRRHTRLQGDWSSDVCSSDLWIPRISQGLHRKAGNPLVQLAVGYLAAIAACAKLHAVGDGAVRPQSPSARGVLQVLLAESSRP